MSKEDKLAKKAAKIEAKQNQLAAKKAAKEQRVKRPEQNYNFVEAPEAQEDGSTTAAKQPKPKKPFYKRWWFILIVAFAILIIIVGIASMFGPSISDNFKLGKTDKMDGLEYKVPVGWKTKDLNNTNTVYTFKEDGDYVGSMEVSYFGIADDMSKIDVEVYLVEDSASDVTYGKMDLPGADKCITADYTYSNDDSGKTYGVRCYMVYVDKAIFALTVKGIDSVDTETADKIIKGFNFKDFVNNVKLKSISAEYTGSRKANTLISSENENITVTAKYSDGSDAEVTDFTLPKSVILRPDKTYKIKVTYDNKSTFMKVTCSTISASHYKRLCNSYSYSTLTHNSDTSLLGKKIKLSGKVSQVVSDGEYRIDVATGWDFGHYVYVTIDNPEKKIVEEDHVTVYGIVSGDISYKTVLGAKETIPAVEAKYID